MPALRAIYRAETAEVAELRLADFEAEWGKKYPAIGPAWRRAWNEVVPFFAYPPQIRKMIYTTNAIESLHRGLRKIIKTRGSFPSDEAANKLLYLAIQTAGAIAVLVLDGAGWHSSPQTSMPDNIVLLPLPPYSPELNPRENVWEFLRGNWSVIACGTPTKPSSMLAKTLGTTS